ncbi:MAG: IclR family transcriptional regulator [Asticcacaulis sp.]
MSLDADPAGKIQDDKVQDDKGQDDKGIGKYRAPALEKGLDVLELLAAERAPLTLSQISSRLDRSVGELFRMVQVLETRGYVAASPRGDGFELTNKLFSLGLSRGPNQNLLLCALPLMQELSELTRQACHLAIASDDRMVVIARMEAPGDLGFSVRVGYQRHLCRATSGIVLYAFQTQKVREAWRNTLRAGVTAEEWQTFEARVEEARAQGYVVAKSSFTEGITDLSCPVGGGVTGVAALTMPFIRSADTLDLEATLAHLKATASALSQLLAG